MTALSGTERTSIDSWHDCFVHYSPEQTELYSIQCSEHPAARPVALTLLLEMILLCITLNTSKGFIEFTICQLFSLKCQHWGSNQITLRCSPRTEVGGIITCCVPVGGRSDRDAKWEQAFRRKGWKLAAHRGGKWDELFSDAAGAAANKGPSKVLSFVT